MECGFFGEIQEATIKNVYIEGKLQSEKGAGGIIYKATKSYIYNCYNNITVTRSVSWRNSCACSKQLFHKLC